ncbi:hypothetical protein SAMN05216229_102233 [Geopseudomonas sagittaria]|uniref:Uncharacterized protein n=1 Tax=Geopseudomonas sagittaria TaxID=1135990 RepID=A0A1I5Q8C1_9GAMM|nr:hypothetical protein [Pseudomonas sagittaria]SFP42432.1 hypothetical protein SAMN05216229_102233 [Pseudomonas sagittaria]
MACGDINWWRAPDLKGLLARHGQIEHLIIQFDFLVQLLRDPRAEFSIPRASKTEPGKSTGYADIVAIASNEIWEIKPKHLEAAAVNDAAHYVGFAKLGCSPDWLPGKSYRVSDWAKAEYGAENVVYRAEAEGMRYELVCEQGAPGAAIYHWRVNGKEQGALDNAMGWAVRGKVVFDYFGGQRPAPIKDQRAPNNIPPIKFKPPVLSPDACIPILQPLLATLQKTMTKTCTQYVMEGGGIAVLLEEAAVNAIYGAANVARAVESMRVQTNPQVEFARALQLALGGAGTSYGIPFAMWLLGYAVVVACEFGAPAAAPAATPAAGGAAAPAGAELLAMYTTAMRSMAARVVTTASTTLVAVAVPRLSQAAAGKPAAVDLFPVKFHPLKPREMALARTGQIYNLGGADHYIVGLASPFG